MYTTPSVMGSAHVNRMCGYVGDVLAMIQSMCGLLCDFHVIETENVKIFYSCCPNLNHLFQDFKERCY